MGDLIDLVFPITFGAVQAYLPASAANFQFSFALLAFHVKTVTFLA
jgi:hypothetical protein